MSRLGTLENQIVGRLQGATIGGQPVFAVVAGFSGGDRPALRDALHRARMPAAFVAFVEEPTAPETGLEKRGAQFSLIVAARLLRQGGDPRHGDDDALGAFTLIDTVKQRLDDYEPSAGFVLQNLRINFLDADDRTAVYELRYRVWPVPSKVWAPGEPQNLTGSSTFTSGEVRLDWNPPQPAEEAGEPDYYRVYRKRAADPAFSLHDTAAKNSVQKTLADQPAGELLKFYVTAANTAGESLPSNIVSLTL